jgi:hypothetical protein
MKVELRDSDEVVVIHSFTSDKHLRVHEYKGMRFESARLIETPEGKVDVFRLTTK